MRIFFQIFVAITIFLLNVIFRSSPSRLGSYNGNGYDDITLARWITNYFNKRNSRINALKNASAFIKPYEKIFGNHVLSNKHCAISLNAKKKQIICISSEYNKLGQRMMLIADRFTSIDIDEYFDMMCGIFNYNTNYENVLKSLETVAIINENVYSSKPVKNEEFQKTENTPQFTPKEDINIIDIKKVKKISELEEIADKTDVNSASEAELTALPGVNIIVAKKIIYYRETQRPFKSIDDFFEVMKFKPHFVEQLKSKICANKINMKKYKKAKTERIIDL